MVIASLVSCGPRTPRNACVVPERCRSWGILREPGMWQDEAAADWVFHLPPRPISRRWAIHQQPESFARARLSMDTHLLDAVASGATRRIVYVADTSSYGAAGSRAITEDEAPRPSAMVRCLAPALDRVDGYVVSGLPIVTALPGWASTETGHGSANVLSIP